MADALDGERSTAIAETMSSARESEQVMGEGATGPEIPTERADDAKDSTLELERAKKEEAAQSVSLRKLFGFADGIDVLLMILGSIGAMATGVSEPLMTLLFGELINAFGQNYGTNTLEVLVREVNKVRILTQLFPKLGLFGKTDCENLAVGCHVLWALKSPQMQALENALLQLGHRVPDKICRASVTDHCLISWRN